MKIGKHTLIVVSSLLICLTLVTSDEKAGLEWTDPETKTYFNIESLKKDPK